MRKLLILLMLLLLPLFAQAEGLTLSPTEAGFAYDFTLEDEWVRLHYKGPAEKGIKTLYAPGGHFTGEIETRCGEGGKYTVTIESLELKNLLKETVQLPAKAGYVTPEGKSNVAVKQLQLEETPHRLQVFLHGAGLGLHDALLPLHPGGGQHPRLPDERRGPL